MGSGVKVNDATEEEEVEEEGKERGGVDPQREARMYLQKCTTAREGFLDIKLLLAAGSRSIAWREGVVDCSLGATRSLASGRLRACMQ